jgi:hypothetical protein
MGPRPSDQVLPAIALTPSGGVVAYFNQGQGIYGAVLGSELTSPANFSVNKTATGDQVRPSVKALLHGNTVYVWQSKKLGTADIFARFAKGTAFYTSDIRVNTYIKDQQVEPAAAALPDGGVMVVWSSYGQEQAGSPVATGSFVLVGPELVAPRSGATATRLWGVYARKLTATGAGATASEFRVNQFVAGNQRLPTVCTLANGNVVFAWVSEQERSVTSLDIYARVFTPAGVPVTHEFLVNTVTNKCASPALAALNGGGFTVAWGQKDTVLTNGWDVWGRAFSANGTPVVPPFRINSYLFGDQYAPRLAKGPNGVLAVWTSMGQDGDREGVFGRYLLGGDKVSGNEFPVNTTVVSQQLEPDVEWNGADRFLVVWTSFAGASGFDLYGRMYVLTP